MCAILPRNLTISKIPFFLLHSHLSLIRMRAVGLALAAPPPLGTLTPSPEPCRRGQRTDPHSHWLYEKNYLPRGVPRAKRFPGGVVPATPAASRSAITNRLQLARNRRLRARPERSERKSDPLATRKARVGPHSRLQQLRPETKRKFCIHTDYLGEVSWPPTVTMAQSQLQQSLTVGGFSGAALKACALRGRGRPEAF